MLGELDKDELEEMPEICERVIAGIKAFATAGPDRAMNSVNTKPKKTSEVDTPKDGEAPAPDTVKPHPEG